MAGRSICAAFGLSACEPRIPAPHRLENPMNNFTIKNHYLKSVTHDEGVQRAAAAVVIAVVVAATKAALFRQAP